MSEQHAIIDIGSNTVRLVIYDGPPRAPSVLLNEKVTARLGREVARTGLLAEKAVATALAALGRYAALLKLMEVTNVEVVATAAVRDAANGAAFLEDVRALGLAPRLLSGAEEARISAMGVIAAFPGARGIAGDLGGGSLELTPIGDGGSGEGITLPFGTLRLAELRAGGAARFTGRLRKSLAAAGWSAGRGAPFYLVGGSWRAFAIYAIRQLGWPLDDPHGFQLAPEPALRMARTLAQGRIEAEVPRISSSRLAMLPDAAALLGALVAELEPSCLVFSSWGLREGLFFERLDPATRAQDPLLAGVAAFVEGLGIDAATATMVCGWTADVSAPRRAGDERLRLAAAMLALAEMRSEPNFRAEEAMDWALRKRWIGIDARGRAMLAMALQANTGRTTVPSRLTELASEEDLAEAAGWGLAIRLCRRFTGCVPQALSSNVLLREEGRLSLVLREPFHALYTDGIGKDLRNLGEWLGLDAAVELIPEGAV